VLDFEAIMNYYQHIYNKLLDAYVGTHIVPTHPKQGEDPII